MGGVTPGDYEGEAKQMKDIKWCGQHTPIKCVTGTISLKSYGNGISLL